MTLFVIMMGWPAVIVSALLILTGLARSRWRLVLWGAAIGTPFLLYLLLSSRFRWFALAAGICQWSAVFAAGRGRRGLALALVVPFFVVVVVVARLVLAQFRG